MRLTTTKKKEPELFDGLENIDENKYFVKFQTDEPTTLECIADKLGPLEDILEGHSIETLEELDGLLWYVKKIKDIEEELGIDLITLFKIIWKYGPTIYTKAGHIYDTNYSRHLVVDGHYYIHFYKDNEYAGAIDISQYKETWALTREELL